MIAVAQGGGCSSFFRGRRVADEVDLNDEIAEQALQAEQVTVDGVTVKNRSLSDLIAAKKHLDGKAAAKKSALPIRFAKITPGGAA
jgi:hypothetical protein